MDTVARLLAKLLLLFSLLMGHDELSRAARADLRHTIKASLEHLLDLGKKVIP